MVGLVDGKKAELAAKYLVENIEARDGHLSTGFIGTKDLMLALAQIGRNDVAYRLIHTDTIPTNTTATVLVPAKSADTITESGKPQG